MDDELLRERVRWLKVYDGMNYATFADLLQMRRSSFYNWMKRQYNFSESRKRELLRILQAVDR